MCNFWNFGHLTSFMPKYDNFENQPLPRKSLPIEQNDGQFRHPGIERECMCNFWNFGPWATKLVVKQSAKAHGPLVIYLFIWAQVFNGWMGGVDLQFPSNIFI